MKKQTRVLKMREVRSIRMETKVLLKNLLKVLLKENNKIWNKIKYNRMKDNRGKN